MSSDLDTWEAVDSYAAEHGGVDPLRMMIAQGTVAGKRKAMVEYYLRQYDGAVVATQREAQALESLKLAERSAIAAEQSAAATDRAATASERSARYAMYTAFIALVAIIVTVVIDLYRQHS